MTVLFIDGSAGASGDMILGALIDLGLPVAPLRRALQSLPVEGWSLQSRKIERCALAGRKVSVRLRRGTEQPGRDWKALRKIVSAGDLPNAVRDKSLAVFRRLLEAEGAVHGRSADTVHLHEAGGVDAIVDIVGACWGVHALGVERIVVSPLTTGFGSVRCAHGEYPLPAPATLELCRGLPVEAGTIAKERLTPTGAALLVTLADAWGEMPPMLPRRIGYGAGDLDLSPHPNMLRAVLGDTVTGRSSGSETRTVHRLECQIDDSSAEELAFAAERILSLGALDVYRTPVAMKKGRLGTLMTAIVLPEDSGRIARCMLTETSSLGVRIHPETRVESDREILRVKTRFGPVDVKYSPVEDSAEKAAPEYEDCKKLALRHDVPIRRVQQAALEAFAAARSGQAKARRSNRCKD